MAARLVQDHPAETAMPIATVIAALICKALGVADTDTIFYIALVISFIPTMVTWLVNKGLLPWVKPGTPTTES